MRNFLQVKATYIIVAVGCLSLFGMSQNVYAAKVLNISCDWYGIVNIETDAGYSGSSLVETKTNSYFTASDGLITVWAYGSAGHLISWTTWNTWHDNNLVFPLDFAGVSVDWFASTTQSDCGNPYEHINDTRFISVVPSGNGYIATSSIATTTSISFYVSTDNSNTVIGFFQYFIPGTGATTTYIGSERDLYALPQTFGYMTAATSTDISEPGVYVTQANLWDIGNPLFGIFNTKRLLVATTTYFFVGATSTFTIGDFMPRFDLSSCNLLSGFDISKCLHEIIFPDPVTFKYQMDVIWDGLGKIFPIGYVTAFIRDISTTTVLELPKIDLHIPEGIPGFGSHLVLGVDQDSLGWIFNATSSFSYLGDVAVGKSLWQIVQPYWDILCWSSLVLFILARILGAYVISQSVISKHEYEDRVVYKYKK